MNDGELLLSAYLDRDLGTDAATGLLAAVRDDAELRRRFLRLARIERLLASELGPIALDQKISAALARLDQPWVDGVMCDVRSLARRPSPRRRARRRPAQRWVPMAMAALLAVAVAAAWAVFSDLSPSASAVPPLASGSGESIEQRHGRLSAAVAPHAPGRPLAANANGLEATSRFALSVGEEPHLAVGPGHSGVAAAGPRFTVWSVDRAWNEVVSDGRILAGGGAASVPTSSEQRNPSFEPDQYICLQSDRGVGDRALFSIPAGVHLRLRLRSERAGEAQLTLEAPVGGAVRERIHGSTRFTITPEWRELVLAPADLDGGSGLPVDLPVRTICLWGFAAGTVELAELAVERRSSH